MTATTEERAPAAPRRRRAVDPAVTIALAISVAFVAIAICWPVVAMVGSSLTGDALPVFERYLTPPQNQILFNTIILGVLVATVGTLVGFLFAFVQVRVPLPRLLK